MLFGGVKAFRVVMLNVGLMYSLLYAERLFLDSLSSKDLKRFSEARRTSKLSTFVNFPMKDLDLREFASENSSK